MRNLSNITDRTFDDNEKCGSIMQDASQISSNLPLTQQTHHPNHLILKRIPRVRYQGFQSTHLKPTTHKHRLAPSTSSTKVDDRQDNAAVEEIMMTGLAFAYCMLTMRIVTIDAAAGI